MFTFAESIGSVGHVPDHVRLIGKTDVSTEQERERESATLWREERKFRRVDFDASFLRGRVNEKVKKALLLTTCGQQSEIYLLRGSSPSK